MMTHNIFFIIIITATLMFLDFYLTIKGARLYKLKFSEFVKVDNYELNPTFQKNIAEFKYDLRHLLSVILVSLLICLFYYLSENNIIFNPQNFTIIPGSLFTLFGYINANHLRNIIIFKAVNKNPDILKGQIEQSYQFSIKTAQAQILVILIPLLIVFIMMPSYFVSGAVLGIILIYMNYGRWKNKSIVKK